MAHKQNNTTRALVGCLLAATLSLFATRTAYTQSIYSRQSFLYLYGAQSLTQQESAVDLIATPDSGFILLALYEDTCLLVRVNPLGVPVWSRSFYINGLRPISGHLQLSPSDSFVIVALTMLNYTTFMDSVVLAVVNRITGAIKKVYLLTGPSLRFSGPNIAYNPADNTFVLACTANDTAIFVTKFSLKDIMLGGGVRWAKLLGRPTPSTFHVEVSDVKITKIMNGRLSISGNFIDTAGGTTISPAFLLTLDDTGTIIEFSYYALQTQNFWFFSTTATVPLSNTHLALLPHLYTDIDQRLALIVIDYSTVPANIRFARTYYHPTLAASMLASAHALPGGGIGVMAGLNDSTILIMAVDTIVGNYSKLCISYPPLRLIPGGISHLRGERFAIAASTINFSSPTDRYGIMLGGMPASLNAQTCGIDTSGCTIATDTLDSLIVQTLGVAAQDISSTIVFSDILSRVEAAGRYDIVDPLCGIGPIRGYALDTQSGVVLPSRGVSVQPGTLGNISAVADTFTVWGVTDTVNYIIALPWGRIDTDSLVATYYPSAAHWSDAQLVAAPDTVAIILKRKPQPPAGLCKIRGIIREGSWHRAPGDPIADIVIILSGDTSASVVVATTTSSTDGTFEFVDIAPGRYWVIPDVTGIPVEVSNAEVLLSREGDSVQVTFVVDTNIIRASVTGSQPTALPTPESPTENYLPVTVKTDVSGALFIYIHQSLAGARIRILNTAGATIARWQIAPADRLYHFKPSTAGIYLIEIETPQGKKLTLRAPTHQ